MQSAAGATLGAAAPELVVPAAEPAAGSGSDGRDDATLSLDREDEIDEEEPAEMTLRLDDGDDAPRIVACLRRLSPPAVGQTFDLAIGASTLGTGDCDVGFDRVIDRAVSRKHARIDIEEVGGRLSCTVTDLKSSNGTYVGGKRLNGVQAIEDGSVIKLGNLELQFLITDPEILERLRTFQLADLPAEPLTLDARRTVSIEELEARPVVARLRRLSPPQEGQIYELRLGQTTLGCQGTTIVFPADQDRVISRRHAQIEIERTEDGFRCLLSDLGSANGTYFEDRRIDEAVEIFDQATIRLGNIELLFLLSNPPAVQSPPSAASSQPSAAPPAATPGPKRPPVAQRPRPCF